MAATISIIIKNFNEGFRIMHRNGLKSRLKDIKTIIIGETCISIPDNMSGKWDLCSKWPLKFPENNFFHNNKSYFGINVSFIIEKC